MWVLLPEICRRRRRLQPSLSAPQGSHACTPLHAALLQDCPTGPLQGGAVQNSDLGRALRAAFEAGLSSVGAGISSVAVAAGTVRLSTPNSSGTTVATTYSIALVRGAACRELQLAWAWLACCAAPLQQVHMPSTPWPCVQWHASPRLPPPSLYFCSCRARSMQQHMLQARQLAPATASQAACLLVGSARRGASCPTRPYVASAPPAAPALEQQTSRRPASLATLQQQRGRRPAQPAQ